MATINQIEYLKNVKDAIKEPILIIGSKIYDYDAKNIEKELKKLGFSEIIGVDIFDGEGVDYVADICDTEAPFFKERKGYFNTVICMEILTHVKYPWLAGKNINELTKKNGYVIMSECFVRKFSRMPKDYWRFTYDCFKILCSDFDFDDSRAMKSLTRAKKPSLKAFDGEIFQIMHEKNEEETSIGFYLRGLHRKFFSGDVFKVSRLLPEQTFYAIGKKK